MPITYQTARKAAAAIAKAGIMVHAAAGVVISVYAHDGKFVIVERSDGTRYVRPAGALPQVRYQSDANFEGKQTETDEAWQWTPTATSTATATNPTPV